MPVYLHISNGHVYDPTRDCDGVVQDLFVADGKIVESLPTQVPASDVQTIDARHCCILPGGIDPHTHVASPRVTALQAAIQDPVRLDETQTLSQSLQADRRCIVLTSQEAAKAYCQLGYTLLNEASVRPNEVDAVKASIQTMADVQVAFLLEMGNNETVFDALSRGDEPMAVDYTAALIRQTGAFGIKLSNPGGLIGRRHGQEQELASVDEPINATSVTTRRILQWASKVANHLNLSHPPHVHAPRLGMPGNIESTLNVLDVFEGQAVHLAHAQFYSYGQTTSGGYTSAADRLAEYLARHPHVTADVGQIAFGSAVTVTEDDLLLQRLRRVFGQAGLPKPKIDIDTSPLPYNSPDTSTVLWMQYSPEDPVHSLMWATGLELILSCQNLWQLSLSVDHPNGGPFTAYPQIIAWLMDKTARDEQLAKIHPYARQHSRLGQFDRELSLQEIAILTRSAPAKSLGLKHKGHLGSGADADIAIYASTMADQVQGEHIKEILTHPRYVIKSGDLVVVDGRWTGGQPARLVLPDHG